MMELHALYSYGLLSLVLTWKSCRRYRMEYSWLREKIIKKKGTWDKQEDPLLKVISSIGNRDWAKAFGSIISLELLQPGCKAKMVMVRFIFYLFYRFFWNLILVWIEYEEQKKNHEKFERLRKDSYNFYNPDEGYVEFLEEFYPKSKRKLVFMFLKEFFDLVIFWILISLRGNEKKGWRTKISSYVLFWKNNLNLGKAKRFTWRRKF